MMKQIGKLLLLAVLVVLVTTGCKESKKYDVTNTKGYSVEDLSFEVPAILEYNKGSSNDSKKQFSSYLNNEKDYCYMFVAVKEGSSSSDLQKTIYTGLDRSDSIDYSHKTINGEDWTTGYSSSVKSSKYYLYAIYHNNKLYEFSYRGSGTGDICTKIFKVVEKSLKFNQ